MVWTDGNRNGKWNESDQNVHINGILYRDYRGMVLSSVGQDTTTSGTSETDLGTVVVPANILGSTGSLSARAFGWFEGGAGIQTFKLYFDTGSTTIFSAIAAGSWKFEATLRNLAYNSQVIVWKFYVDGSPGLVYTGWYNVSVGTNADRTLKITGQCPTDPDKIHIVDWRVAED